MITAGKNTMVMRSGLMKGTAYVVAELKKMDKTITLKDAANVATISAGDTELGNLIAEALKKAGIDVERKNIEMNEDAIKTLGTYSAKVRLFKEIAATINFEVIAE